MGPWLSLTADTIATWRGIGLAAGLMAVVLMLLAWRGRDRHCAAASTGFAVFAAAVLQLTGISP